MEYTKKENCVSREFYHEILGLFAGLFKGDSGNFQGRCGEGVLSTIGRGLSGAFGAHPGTPVPSAPDSPSFVTTEDKHPRDSRGHDKGDRRSWGVERKKHRGRCAPGCKRSDSPRVTGIIRQPRTQRPLVCRLPGQGGPLAYQPVPSHV